MRSLDERVERQVVRFLQLLFEGKISDAERMIEGMEKRSRGTELNGYVTVLKGILLSYTTDDRTSLLHRVYSSDDPKKELESFVKAMAETDLSFDDSRSPVVEVWEVILRNFDKLPTPHRFRGAQEDRQQRLDQTG
ncbi:MAG: hypothetical protein QXP81_08410 [Nitrososphaerota archaeon]|nr:hypothetical protein [Candidatus Calditenuis fumarioli]